MSENTLESMENQLELFIENIRQVRNGHLKFLEIISLKHYSPLLDRHHCVRFSAARTGSTQSKDPNAHLRPAKSR
jgi:site-specific recombinase XerD